MNSPEELRKLLGVVESWNHPDQCPRDASHPKLVTTKEGDQEYLSCTQPGCGYKREDRPAGGEGRFRAHPHK